MAGNMEHRYRHAHDPAGRGGAEMSEAILTFFRCLTIYRAICAGMNWSPWPVVQITINNNAAPPDA